MILEPERFARLSQGSGLPKDNAITGGFASSVASKNLGKRGMKSLINPTANGAGVIDRIRAISLVNQSVSFRGWMPPKLPNPPDFETAAASVPPLCIAIGADMIGYLSPNNSVKRVRIIDAPFLNKHERKTNRAG